MACYLIKGYYLYFIHRYIRPNTSWLCFASSLALVLPLGTKSGFFPLISGGLHK
jgi:hypothetical protein